MYPIVMQEYVMDKYRQNDFKLLDILYQQTNHIQSQNCDGRD